jgi:threonine 3-dehydrogenase
LVLRCQPPVRGPVLTHRMKIDEFQKGFDLMASGQCGKVVLDWN